MFVCYVHLWRNRKNVSSPPRVFVPDIIQAMQSFGTGTSARISPAKAGNDSTLRFSLAEVNLAFEFVVENVVLHPEPGGCVLVSWSSLYHCLASLDNVEQSWESYVWIYHRFHER